VASAAEARRGAVEAALGREINPCDPVDVLWRSLARAGWRIEEAGR